MGQTTSLRLLDLFRYYKGEPHQMAAISELEQAIRTANPHILGREQSWYRNWIQAGRTPEPSWLAPAIQIIQQFEGCRLKAYPDPASGAEPWSIGWGATRLIDRPVKSGDVISQELADELLQNTVEITARELFKLLPLAKRWSGHRVAALISWAYNCGLGAVAESTLVRRLNSREDPTRVIRDELPRWNNANGKTLEGLTRRRAAEVALFTGAGSSDSAGLERQHQPARLTPSAAFSMHLTPHIRLGEFALDQEERRFQHQHQVDTAAELAAFLERARRVFGGKPVIITSGYRPPAINAACGGASASEHLFSAAGVGAVDWFIAGVKIQELQDWCLNHWPYSTGKGADRGFIHTGIRAGRPRMVWDY